MNFRRNLRVIVLFVAALALSAITTAGCAHNTHTWMQTEPVVHPGGMVQQRIWTR